MLNCGKHFALCATKKNILTLVLSEKKFLNEKNKNITPSCKLNGRSLKEDCIHVKAYILKEQFRATYFLQVKWSVP